MLMKEQIVNLRNILPKLKGKEIVLFGAGSASTSIIDFLDSQGDYPVAYCVDNNKEKWGQSIRNLTIQKPTSLLDNGMNYAILIASQFTAPIANQLDDMGFEKTVHYFEIYKDASYKIAEDFISNPFPATFGIVLGTAPCNHSCLFCPQSIEKPSKASWLDMNSLEKVLHEVPERGVEIQLNSYSETIVAPNLIPALELIAKIRPEIEVGLNSNGVCITEEILNNIIDVGNVKKLSFSFDAADRESYRSLMGIDNYHLAEEKLEMVCHVKESTGSDMLILVHIMGFENQKNIFIDFENKWKNKVDKVWMRDVLNWGDETIGLKDQLARHGFISIYQPPRERYACSALFNYIVLNYDGNYYPCCGVAYPTPNKPNEYKEFSLGNLAEITLKEAWDKMDWHRYKHITGKWNECYRCVTCDTWGIYPDITLPIQEMLSVKNL